MSLKILALITARKSSKRLPRKNLRTIEGKPLVSWTIDFIKNIKEVSDIMITTDDEKICKIAKNKGIICPWLRPKYLSKSNTSSEDTILHSVKWFEKNVYKLDGVLLLQPTTPFRSKSKIKKALKIFSKKKDKPIISVSKILNNERLKKFIMNGSFYLSSASYIKKNKKKFVKSKFYPVKLTRKVECIDINTLDDLNLAKNLYKKYIKN